MNKTYKETLVMLYPYDLFNNYYIRFYDDFLKDYILEISNEVRIVLIVINENAKNELINKFGDSKYEVVVIPEAVDIWIRDWAPIPVKFTSGEVIYLKPNFTPGYYKRKEKNYIPSLKIACDKLSDYLGLQITELPLNTDGGNFAFNGKDTIILTNRIISNNETLSIEEIKNIYKRTLGINNVIIIPVEPEDVTGHTDGTLRFVDEKTIIIGEYPEKDEVEYEFVEKLTEELIKQLGNDCKIIRLENDIINDGIKGSDILSASGNHINFLNVYNRIFLPTYGIESDERAYSLVLNEIPSCDIINVKTKELLNISRDGGVLNCVTWG